MCTEAVSCGAGSSGVRMIPSRVWFESPVAGRVLGPLEGMMGKLVTVEVLGRLVDVGTPFQQVGRGESRQA
jgi:hypothetical protein